MKDIQRKTYFRLNEKDFGKRLMYVVTLGSEQYIYEHDYVYRMLIDKYEIKDCWKKYGCYNNTRNIPADALKYVTKI
jgi:hypothetical protein